MVCLVICCIVIYCIHTKRCGGGDSYDYSESGSVHEEVIEEVVEVKHHDNGPPDVAYP